MNRRHFSRILVLIFCATACWVRQARAHDSWLIVDESRANDGDRLWLSFVTGEAFPLGERPTDPARVESWLEHYDGRMRRLDGFAPQDRGLALRHRIEGGGYHVFGCALKPRLIELSRSDFETYLRLERAAAALARFTSETGEGSKEPVVVERYTKFAKTIVQVHPAADDDASYQKPIGHRLEIIPLSNPCAWKSGETVRVKVLLDGHPWTDVPVSAGHEDVMRSSESEEASGDGPKTADPLTFDGAAAASTRPTKTTDADAHAYAVETRTDDRGMAEIKLHRPGHWFIKAHLIRPVADLGKVRWESFWASLTFRAVGKIDVTGQIQSIRAIHGGLSPAAVAGYRMGRAALEAFDCRRGDRRLRAVVRSPVRSEFLAAIDGIQAATGLSIGQMNLALEVLDDATDTSVVFTDGSTGRILTFTWSEQLASLIRTTSADEIESTGLRACTLPDRDVFKVVDDSTSAVRTTVAENRPGRSATGRHRTEAY